MTAINSAPAGAASNVTAKSLQASALGGFVSMINGKIVESRTAGAATFAVKTIAGADPSALDPVLFVFNDGTGAYVERSAQAALSFTISSGSLVGAANGTAFRLWIAAVDDAGTVRLGVQNCSDANRTYPFSEGQPQSSTAEGGAGAADSVGVFYTGVAVTSKFARLLARADYESGLTTAGTWDAAPTRIVLLGPGSYRPGQVVQMVPATTGVAASSASTTFVDTNLTATITPTSPINPVLVSGSHQEIYNGGASDTFGTVRLVKGAGPTVVATFSGVAGFFTATGGSITPFGWGPVYDRPLTAAAITYKTQLNRAGGTGTIHIQNNGGASAILLQEIMG